MKKIITTIFTCYLFIICAQNTYAQVSASIKLSPKNPEPKSSVTLTVESYSFDTETAFYTWKVEGATVVSGQGKDSITIRTGDVGTSLTVEVLAETKSGTQVAQTITITPASVSLVYEAPKSYVPLLYEGRSQPSVGGIVSVTALPSLSDDGVSVPQSSVAYSWYVNDVFNKSLSGFGKQSALIRLDYLQEVSDVKVVARSPGGVVATKTIKIRPHAVMPLLYTADPVLGTNFASLITRRFEAVKDFTLALEPFYVSNKEAKEVNYSWYLDGSPITPLGGLILNMGPQKNTYGSKKLTITVKGGERGLQNAETNTELIFDTRK